MKHEIRILLTFTKEEAALLNCMEAIPHISLYYPNVPYLLTRARVAEIRDALHEARPWCEDSSEDCDTWRNLLIALEDIHYCT